MSELKRKMAATVATIAGLNTSVLATEKRFPPPTSAPIYEIISYLHRFARDKDIKYEIGGASVYVDGEKYSVYKESAHDSIPGFLQVQILSDLEKTSRTTLEKKNLLFYHTHPKISTIQRMIKSGYDRKKFERELKNQTNNILAGPSSPFDCGNKIIGEDARKKFLGLELGDKIYSSNNITNIIVETGGTWVCRYTYNEAYDEKLFRQARETLTVDSVKPGGASKEDIKRFTDKIKNMGVHVVFLPKNPLPTQLEIDLAVKEVNK